jgi:hypothetical protein
VEQAFDEAVEFLKSNPTVLFKICDGRLYRYTSQAKWLTTFLMPGQVIPESIDQRPNQLIGIIQAVEHRQLAAPQSVCSGDAEGSGVAMLPRNRVRTSWKGTGHACLSSRTRIAGSLRAFAAVLFAISATP